MNEEAEAVVAVEAQEAQTNPVESKALSQGWRPKEQFQGDPNDWVPADEFVRRGDLLAEISKRGKENKDLQRQIAMIEKQFAEVRQRTYEEALTKLRAERDLAIETGDKYRVYDIENKIAQVQKPDTTPQPVNQLPPEVNDFVARNSSWFNDSTPENIGLKAEAIAYEQSLPQTMTVSERLERVETYMKNKMHKQPKDPVASSVSEAKTVKTSGKKTYESLSAQEKSVCDRFVRMGAFKDRQEYVDALIAQEESYANKNKRR